MSAADNLKPAPMDYGFSSGFDDLSTVAPSRTKSASKPKAKKTTKPKPAKTKAKQPIADADITAKAHGFSSREAKPVLLKKRRRTHHDEPVDQLSIRGPVRILNDFINYCEETNLSYWEGLDALIQNSSKK